MNIPVFVLVLFSCDCFLLQIIIFNLSLSLSLIMSLFRKQQLVHLFHISPNWEHIIEVELSIHIPYGASLLAQLVKNPPAMQESWVSMIRWRRKSYPLWTLGPPCWLRWERIHLQCRRPGFNPRLGRSHRGGDMGLIPGLGIYPGGGHGNPLQYSCLENPHGQRSLAGTLYMLHMKFNSDDLLELKEFRYFPLLLSFSNFIRLF